MSKKDIKEKIKELEGILENVEDLSKRKDLMNQISELESILPSPWWKKAVKYIAIASMLAGLALTIIQIALVFL